MRLSTQPSPNRRIRINRRSTVAPVRTDGPATEKVMSVRDDSTNVNKEKQNVKKKSKTQSNSKEKGVIKSAPRQPLAFEIEHFVEQFGLIILNITCF